FGTATWNIGTLPAGVARQVRLQAQVNSNASGTISNIAQVTSNETPGSIGSNAVSVTVTPQPQPPVLMITKQVDRNTAAPGDSLTYTLNYANIGGTAANPGVILDQLPPGVTFATSPNSAQLVNATPPSTGLFVRFSLGIVPPGASGSVQFTVTINSNVG